MSHRELFASYENTIFLVRYFTDCNKRKQINWLAMPTWHIRTNQINGGRYHYKIIYFIEQRFTTS